MRRGFGQVSKLRSGRHQARWQFNGKYYTARVVDDENHDLGPRTFSTEKQAENFLTWVRQEIEAGRWHPPATPAPADVPVNFREYADAWVEGRRNQRGMPLKPTTKAHYRRLLAREVFPKLGISAAANPSRFSDECRGQDNGNEVPDHAVCESCPCPCHNVTLHDAADQNTFEAWYYTLDVKNNPVQTAHSYDLVRSILRTANKKKPRPLVESVPEISGATATKKRRRPIRLLTLDQLSELIAAMPEQYRLMAVLYAWCAVRYGELAALRKKHVNLRDRVIHVERGVTRTKGEWNEDTPKSGEGGDVAIPPHIVPDVEAHIKELKAADLLFPAPRGGFLLAATFHKHFNKAKAKIGRPDIRPHDLRHLGSMLAASAGASPAELMERLRHKTAQASQIYWHAAQGRGREIAERMSEIATEQTKVVPIDARKTQTRKEDTG